MSKTDVILKDLNMIINHIRSSIFDAYAQGKADGYDKGRKDTLAQVKEVLSGMVVNEVIDMQDMDIAMSQISHKEQADYQYKENRGK